MSAAEVAREGYAAMKAGKAEVIAGARNRWMIFGTRFVPRTVLAAVAICLAYASIDLVKVERESGAYLLQGIPKWWV